MGGVWCSTGIGCQTQIWPVNLVDEGSDYLILGRLGLVNGLSRSQLRCLHKSGGLMEKGVLENRSLYWFSCSTVIHVMSSRCLANYICLLMLLVSGCSYSSFRNTMEPWRVKENTNLKFPLGMVLNNNLKT